MKKLIILLGVVGVSLSAILVRAVSAPPMVLVFLRMFFASLVLIPWSVFQNREEWTTLTRRELLLCILAGIFLAIHFTLYFTAVRFTSIASAVLLVDVEVFFVALASPLLLNRRVTGQGWIGIILTFLGSIIIAFSGGRQGANVLLGVPWLWPELHVWLSIRS